MNIDTAISDGNLDSFLHRSETISTPEDPHMQNLTIFLHEFNPESSNDQIIIQFHKRMTTEELIEKVFQLRSDLAKYSVEEFDLYEMMGTPDGQTFKERKLDKGEYPSAVQMLWSKQMMNDGADPKNRFVLRHRDSSHVTTGLHLGSSDASSIIDHFLAKFLIQPQDRQYADLCMLPELTEQTLLDNLKERFNSGHIYTYIGPILVVVNPFQFYPVYNPKYARLYSNSGRPAQLPPHIFAIADMTYHNMQKIKENQCIVISGESGSGKTQSTNFILHHLTTLSQKGSAGSSVEQMLLSAGPVLEAFGNAITVQNNNSSRFGKFIKVNYRENGMVSGASVEIYLLEKSRIISQAKDERNYHVFYYLLKCASDEEREQHFLMQPADYYYLNQNICCVTEGLNEQYEYERLKHSMQAVGFSYRSQQNVFSVLSAVLLLGNVECVKQPGYHSDDSAYVANGELLTMISELLQIKAANLEQALTMRRKILKNETVITRYSVSEAVNTRDAMAKCLYNALFRWIVLRINHALLRRDVSSNKKGFYIGLLDIFGFEDVGGKWNSFEQLCINYANEHLQAYFNQHIFQFEQEEYLKEGIRWTNIEYTDNTGCVELFQNKPCGVLRLIDEESNINNGTDLSMLEKLHQFMKSSEYYEAPQKKESAFIIAHYAGKVKYQIKGFREKNMDLMRQDILLVLKKSRSAFVRELVGDDPIAMFRWNIVRSIFRAASAFRQAGLEMEKPDSLPLSKGQLNEEVSARQMVAKKSSESHFCAFLRGEITSDIVPDFCDKSVFVTVKTQARKQPAASQEECCSSLQTLQAIKSLTEKKRIVGKPSSVSKQFQHSLSSLMKTLGRATPYFIRCIKSNNEKIANNFDDNIILRQLRYTGMLETVRIRRAGYSFRIEYDDFIKQYRILMPNSLNSTKEDVERFFLKHPLIKMDKIQFGITKIFIRDAEKLLIDDQLHRTIMQHVEKLQCWFRTIAARLKYLKLRSTIISIQAMARGMRLRNKLLRKLNCAIILQSHWKRYLAERKYKSIRSTIIGIQSFYRGQRSRKRFEEIKCEGKRRAIISFGISRIIKKTDLVKFDLNDPESLAAFAGSDAEDESSSLTISSTSMNENEEANSETELSGSSRSNSATKLEATFILEDKRMKLIAEKADSDFKRRQSLSTTGPTSVQRVLRRAVSTENDIVSINDASPKEPQGPDFVSKGRMKLLGFTKAKKQLKAFLTRRSEIGTSDDDDVTESLRTSTNSEERIAPMVKKAHSIKMARSNRSDCCALCNKNLTGILGLNLKCANCKLSFHKECSSFSSNIPCQSSISSMPKHDHTPPKKQWDFKSKVPGQGLVPLNITAPKSFNLFKTKQQTDPTDLIIETIDDLRQFNVFIFKKLINFKKNDKKRDTAVDAIFKKSLKEFHMELIGYEAVLIEGKTVLKYDDIINIIEGSLTKVSNQEKIIFPTTLGVNAFRGFLNTFVKERKRKNSRPRMLENVRKKRRKSEVIVVHNRHRFKVDYVHVPTYCEICNQFMWHVEKMYICIGCRVSCHKKCHSKILFVCASSTIKPSDSSERRFFGVNLSSLVHDEQKIPIVINKLFMAIEVRALYVEGIYRKSAAISQVRHARYTIETTTKFEDLDFTDVPVHAMTALVKCFFRELPEPLISFDIYENFLNASDVEELFERIRCLSAIVELLPGHNKNVLDRLMYHLSRVAHQESVNKMNSSNLALIFAPCILRSNQALRAQEQLRDVSRQAICVQSLIDEKLKQFRSILNHIVSLEHASEKITENLRLIDEHNMNFTDRPDAANMETARQLFMEQLTFLDHEKDKLIQDLPPLVPVASIEDLSSGDDQSHSELIVDRSYQEEYAIDVDAPPVFCVLKNLGCTRPHCAKRRKSSRHFRLSIVASDLFEISHVEL